MQREIQDFKEAFQFPLRFDDCGIVWTANHGRAFDFASKFHTDNGFFISDENKILVVELLNGRGRKPKTDLNLTYEDGWVKSNGKDFILIRGWGYLTGTGGLRLDPELAAKLQDDFANYIINCLTNKELINS